MVESVGSKPGPVSDVRLAPVARVASVSTAPAPATPAESASVATIAKALAATPPVDADRVREIKAAVANGTFPIAPARIADRLIALRYDWLANDKA